MPDALNNIEAMEKVTGLTIIWIPSSSSLFVTGIARIFNSIERDEREPDIKTSYDQCRAVTTKILGSLEGVFDLDALRRPTFW